MIDQQKTFPASCLAAPAEPGALDRALRARLIDSRVRFDTEVQPGVFDQFRDKLHAWVTYLFGSKPQTQAPAAPVRHVAPKPAPLAPVAPAVPQASSASSGFEASAPRELPPLLGAPHGVASGPVAASNAGAIGMSASEAAALMGAPPRATQGNGGFPSEGPSSTPTPTPDVPEAAPGKSTEQP